MCGSSMLLTKAGTTAKSAAVVPRPLPIGNNYRTQEFAPSNWRDNSRAAGIVVVPYGRNRGLIPNYSQPNPGRLRKEAAGRPPRPPD